jgi:uncharacterized protein YrzB (UPF0473 family)
MENMTFEVKNELGEPITCNVLHTFIKDNKNYMIYTDNELDADGNIEVLAATYVVDGDKLNIEPIETDAEWEMVDKVWSEVNA